MSLIVFLDSLFFVKKSNFFVEHFGRKFLSTTKKVNRSLILQNVIYARSNPVFIKLRCKNGHKKRLLQKKTFLKVKMDSELQILYLLNFESSGHVHCM